MHKGIVLINHFSFFILIGFLFVVTFYGSNATVDPVLMPRFIVWAAVTCLLSVLALTPFLSSRLNADNALFKRKMFWAFAGYFVFSALSICQAVNTTESVHYTLKVFVGMSFLFLTTCILSKDSRYINILIRTVIILGLLLSALTLFEYFRNSFVFGSATMANPNLLSAALFFMLPFCFYGLMTFGFFLKMISLTTILSMLFIMYSLKARSVWLAFLVAAAAVTALFFLYSNNRSLFSMSKRNYIMLAVCTLVLLAAFVVATGYFDVTTEVQAAGSKEVSSTESITERMLMWKKSLNIVKDHFFSGVGQGNWKLVLPSYGIVDLTASSFRERHFQRPHNDFLWVLCETGVVGFLLYVMIFGTALWYLHKILMSDPDKDNRTLAYCITFGMIGYIVFASFSYPRERVFHSAFLMLMLSVTIVIYSRLFPKRQVLPRPILLFGALIAIAGTVLAGYNGMVRAKAEVFTKRAQAARSRQDWTAVVAEIDRGYSDWATLDNASTPLAWYRGEAHFLMGNNPQALQDFERAYKAHPHHIHVLNNLGSAYETADRHEKAIACYREALAMYPDFHDASVNLGATYYNAGKYQQANKILQKQWQTHKTERVKHYLQEVQKKLDNNMIAQ